MTQRGAPGRGGHSGSLPAQGSPCACSAAHAAGPGWGAGPAAHAVFLRLQDNPEKTAANIRGDFWLMGDRAIKDQDGYFQFVGRADDIINSSG